MTDRDTARLYARWLLGVAVRRDRDAAVLLHATFDGGDEWLSASVSDLTAFAEEHRFGWPRVTVANGAELDLVDRLPASRSGRSAMCQAAEPGVFASGRLGYANEPFHWEWYRLMAAHRRLCVVAPRDMAKSECFTVVQTAWRTIFRPGTWTYVFAATGEQAENLKSRVNTVVEQVAPRLLEVARRNTARDTQFANGSRVTVAGAGKAVRGAHPDVIVGDDVLEESTTLTEHQRRKTVRWWMGTVAGMAHPGAFRVLPGGRRVSMPATRIYLVGTPFHADDLLMGMRANPQYRFFRYAAEYDATVGDSWAVEAA